MTDATLTIVLTALPPTFVAAAGLVVSVINSVKANRIHVLVNSRMSQVQSDLASAKSEIESLKKVIAMIAKPKGPE